MATLRRVTALVERYQALVEQIPAVLYINLPDETATTIYVSPQTETILHIPAEAWSQDLDWLDYLHPEDRERVWEDYTRAVRTAPPGFNHIDEYRLIGDDGVEIWVNDRVSVIRDDAGRPTLVQGVMFDVTEQRRAQAILERQTVLAAKVDAIAKRFTALLLEGSDVGKVLEVLAEIVENPVVLDDAAQLLDYAEHRSSAESVLTAWEEHRRSKHDIPDSLDTQSAPLRQTADCAWIPVQLRHEDWGRLHILPMERAFGELDGLALDRAAAAVSLALLTGMEGARLADRARSELIGDIWHGRRRSSREVLARMRSLGTTVTGSAWTAIVAECDLPQSARAERGLTRRRVLDGLLESLRLAVDQSGAPGMCAVVGDLCIALVGSTETSTLTRLSQGVERYAGEQIPTALVVTGSSRPSDIDHLDRALSEANEAAGYGLRVLRRPGLHRIEDLGLHRLLAQLSDGPELSWFVESELGALLALPRAQSETAVTTVRAFIAAGGTKVSAARALHIERRTMYYRLETIERLLGRSLDDPGVRLRLEVALQALDVLHHKSEGVVQRRTGRVADRQFDE